MIDAGVTIAGVAIPTSVEPADRDDLARAVAECARAGGIAFVGGGTDLGLGNAPRDVRTAIRLTRLDRVIDYSPEDQTITVEAGMTLAQLDRLLDEHHQMIPIDVGDRERTTVGGAIAINAFGARRHRFGSIKDLIVGIEIVRADGTRAHSGGKVVKNVAGFDLPKLMVGSLGTLGAIASATFRVYPQPEMTAYVRIDARATNAALMPRFFEAALDATSIAVVESGDDERDGWIVRFDGIAAGVRAQTDRVLAIAASLDLPAHELAAGGVAAYDAIERDVRITGTWRTRESTAPAKAALDDWSYEIPRGIAVHYPSLGSALRAATPPDEWDAVLALARARTEIDGNIIVTAMPLPFRGALDAWGTPPTSMPLMRALKAQFDPQHVCNPGRFVGGL